MSVLFVGGEMGAFIPATAGAVEATSFGANSYNSAFARCCLSVATVSDYAESADFGTGTDLYCHLDMSVYGGGFGSTDDARFRWCDGSGTEVVRLTYQYGTDALRLDYWSGAAWVNAGAITVELSGVLQTIDIHAVVNSASGSLKLYLSGTERISATGLDLSGITALGKVRIYGAPGGHLTFASQVIVADEPTIGMRAFTVPPTGVGASSDWTGTYAEIDEIIYSDADFINSASVNQVSTFAATPPTLTGYQVKAVAVTARAKCGASGPLNIQMAVRSSGTTYFGATKALDVGYRAFCKVWDTDPATSAAWTNTAAATLQPGAKSIT